MRHVAWLTLALALVLAGPAPAHEARPAVLELKELARGHVEVVWRTPLLGERRLSVRLELPAEWQTSVEPTERVLPEMVVERRVMKTDGRGLDGAVIRLPGLEATITDVFVRLSRLDGTTATTVVRPTKPWTELRGERPWHATAVEYVLLGVHHILLGVDHLLFVLGLLLIVRGGRQLVETITAFTLAHSITLGLATLGYATVPLLPLNAAVALSILFLGPEIVRTWRGESSLTIRHPWIVAFAFGLLHGFGFASGLSTTGMPRAEIPLALVSFNVGVELGQLAFIALLMSLARAFRTLEIGWPVWLARAPGYAVGVCGAYWTIERTAFLWAR